MNNHNREIGSINPLIVASLILGLTAAGFAGAFIWSYGNYVDQRDNVAQKVSVAVAEAKKEQASLDEKAYIEKEKQPYNQLASPNDLGRVTVSYPKTWSVYVAKSSSDGYMAYLNPVLVPSISSSQRYALKVEITSENYNSVVSSYEALVKKGSLKSAPITINNFNGVRLDGAFSKDVSGSMVIFKVRDKTLIVSTDIDSAKNDFDNVVVKSIDFNP